MYKLFTLLFLFSSISTVAQDSQNQPDSLVIVITPNNKVYTNKANYNQRKWLIGSLTTAGYGGSFAFLNTAWYKDYPRGSLHVFNDIDEWLQMDKVGHAWTAYHTSRLTSDMWKWAGVKNKNAVMLGTGSSLLYMLSIEYLDGLSKEWGWSWGDVGADIFGGALYAAQELGWKDQKISLKFSSHPQEYSPSLQNRVDSLFGTSFQGKLLKDYNSQTYWLSFNIKSFFPETKLPNWLNMSLGYGAANLLGGDENRDNSGKTSFDRRDIKRLRQWYIAPDIDFEKIPTKSKVLRTLFVALNVLKFPAPALEISDGKLKVRAIAF